MRSRREVGPAESLCFFAGHGEIVGKAFTTEDTLWIYGKRLRNYGKSPFYSWENPLFRLGHGFQFANCECLPEDRRSEVCPVSKTPKIDFIIFFQKAQLHKSHLICFGLWKCLVYFQIQWNINGLLSNGEWNILWFIVICPMAYSILSTYYPMENDIQCFFGILSTELCNILQSKNHIVRQTLPYQTTLAKKIWSWILEMNGNELCISLSRVGCIAHRLQNRSVDPR